MLKVIDLDQVGRDGEGLVLTLTINGEKLGFIDQDVAELLRSKHGGSAKGVKRAPPKKTSQVAEAVPAGDVSSDAPADEGEREELTAPH